MSLHIKKLKTCPHVFLRLTGLKIQEFDKILEKLEPVWEADILSEK